jgi:hypothetical protein
MARRNKRTRRRVPGYGTGILTSESIRALLSENRDAICSGTFEPPIGTWDVSGVEDMEGLFKGWHEFNEPIGEWYTRSVTNMASLFEGCSSFNQPLDWDTSEVIDMSRMFYGCASLAQTFDFEMGEVLTAQDMFGSCDGVKLVARNPNSDVTVQLKIDMLGNYPADSTTEFPVYTLGPNRDRCHGRSRGAHTAVYDTRESRRRVLPALRADIESGRITGCKPMPSAYRWPLIFGVCSSGRPGGVDREYILENADPANDTEDVLVVTRAGQRRATRSRHGAITAFARVDVSDKPKLGFLGDVKVHDSWRRGTAYVPLVVSSVDAPPGHAAEALAECLKLAKESKRMLVLSAVFSAVLWYLNTCFLEDTYQVLVRTRESFEQTRAYALSDRDGIDLERTIKDALRKDLTEVAFVFGAKGVSGRDVLAGMDYAGLWYARPKDLGRYVRMFRASAEPLVRGYSYEYMDYADASTERAQGARGYMYETEDAGFGTKKGRMYGRVYLAGELVRADEDKDYAVFEVEGKRVKIPKGPMTGFRRTFRNYTARDSEWTDDPSLHGVTIKVEPGENQEEPRLRIIRAD